MLDLEIRFHKENFDESSPAYKKLSIEVNQDYVVDIFLAELDKIAAQVSHPRFAKERSVEDFPWTEIKELKQIRRSRISSANKE
ncbi:MAG: hypothetical protein ABGY95_01110 [Rubritalea sp.]|uniref:hypothetical protein n=1 Tax=Rubritalea sp. TaxID=2109375 RepID=UPI003242B19D